MPETWVVSLVLEDADPLELSREPSLKRALIRAAAEIREGRYGDADGGTQTTRPGEVRFLFAGGAVVVQRAVHA